MNRSPAHSRPPARRARGVSLIFALLTLAALSLAAVGLVRSVDTSTSVISNLSFKQDSLFHAGQAAEEAVDWLNANKASTFLHTSQPTLGYSATAIETLDPTNRLAGKPRVVVDWNNDNCATPYASGSFDSCVKSVPMTATAIQGNTARYFITRLCTEAKDAADPTNFCARPINEDASEGGEKGAFSYVNPRAVNVVTAAPYYRIVVRSVGARNSVSFTETLVHF